jgi:hypothetical protein
VKISSQGEPVSLTDVLSWVDIFNPTSVFRLSGIVLVVASTGLIIIAALERVEASRARRRKKG